MGLLDYYRKFEDIDPEETNRELRARRARERKMELERVPTLDLASPQWPDLPNAEVANAAIFEARGLLNRYPDRHASGVRRLLADQHEVAPEQIVLGNGAGELLQSAAFALLGPGDELLTPWPSYPLYPLMAVRAGGRPVAVDLAGGRIDLEALAAAVTDRTRVVVLCNPNDPTGTHLAAEEIGNFVSALPERVHVLLDEAYVQFKDSEPEDAGLRLIDAFPRLLVLRTFSKIYGLAGLRAGYAVGSPSAGELLEALAPVHGVNAMTQAGVRQALKVGGPEIDRRRRMVVAQRRHLLTALHDLPVDAPESEANFVWLSVPRLNGAELAARLERAGVLVAPGGPLGDEDHVRASIRGAASTERLLTGLTQAVG